MGPVPVDLPPLSDYFTHEEFLAAHPASDAPLYHSAEHSALVRVLAFELAKAFGLDPKQRRFVSEVALLHDWDPCRTPGTPARVSETLKVLGLDFVGKRPLTSTSATAREGGESILRERFSWKREDLQAAIAMLYRTEFPFDGAHPNPFYRHAGPSQRYTRCLQSLSRHARAFVLEQAPILAHFADQASWYAMQPFSAALRAVEGLVNESNTAEGSRRSTLDLNTTGFLYTISAERSFDVDYRLARAFGVEGFVLPLHDEVFGLLPPFYGQTFRANKAAFDGYD
ncbi:MAG: hypothetical protein KAI47_23755, partial [Deltaproteobacteria bacterium]|nr:hypothetical protein [Deltaproteobacteria bacterium]